MICYIFKPRRRINGKVQESPNYSGKVRMDWESGQPTVIALGTSDRREAERLLNDERFTREQRHRGMLPPKEEEQAASESLPALLDAFMAELRVLRRSPNTVRKYGNLRVVFGRCHWHKLTDVNPRSFCAWRARSDLAPKSLNDALANTNTLFRWMKSLRMVKEIPLEFVRRVEDRRKEHYRRALSVDEARRLLALADPRRSPIYLILLETGLRRNELKQLTVGDLNFNSPAPTIRVRASISKHPVDALLPVRSGVVGAFRAFIPGEAPPEFMPFAGKVPRTATFKHDLDSARIPFEDAQGRRMDLHALRDTFGTNLAASGVAPVVLKTLMRHSDIKTTMKYYVDASQLPLAAAMRELPNLLESIGGSDTVGRAKYG